MTKPISPDNMPVIFVAESMNSKISFGSRKDRVSATYASIRDTCPKDCVLYKNKECYGMYGNTLFHLRRCEQGAPIHSLVAARVEAELIRAAFKGKRIPQDGHKGGRDLRLHVIGDCRNPTAAKILAEAARGWRARDGGDVWTFCHAWKKIPKDAWNGISVLASIDRLCDAEIALSKGYAPARYIGNFPSESAWSEAGVTWIPCPAQTSADSACSHCRLCLKADKLHAKGMGIAFSAHGVKKGSIKRRLTEEYVSQNSGLRY